MPSSSRLFTRWPGVIGISQPGPTGRRQICAIRGLSSSMMMMARGAMAVAYAWERLTSKGVDDELRVLDEKREDIGGVSGNFCVSLA